MIFSYFKTLLEVKQAIGYSQVYDEKMFYQRFTADLLRAKNEVTIESPFITIGRVKFLKPIFQALIKRNITICVTTRIVEEQCERMQYQAEKGIDILEEMGVIVITEKGNLHRKMAIIDRKILWEGSLNILSQAYSREIMRRINSTALTFEMFNFLKLEKFL